MSEVRSELHWGRVMRCYRERPATVDALFRETVRGDPEALALVDGDARLTYRVLDRRVAALGAGLVACGVRPGDRVAVMLANGQDAVIATLATARIGAVIVPIGTRLRQPEIAYILGDSQAAVLIHGPEFAGELPPATDTAAAAMRFCTGTPAYDALHGPGEVTPAEVDEDDLFGLLYTSGTTGKPKGATLTHLGAVHSALHWAQCLGLRHGERTLLCIPWSHVAGLCGVVLPFLRYGARLVLMREFKRRDFLELAARERITHALLVPAMYGLLLLEPDLASFDLSAWRLGVFGSAPMPQATIERFAQAVPHLVMCNAYGATETTSPATIMPPGEGARHADSIGKVVPCGGICVMDDAGREVAPGETGEFWITGPMVVPGYWRNETADSASFAGGYWKSGDIGSIDADGYVRIADRKKDMINRGGFKVYPAEVENELCAYPGVLEAAVVGRPDDVLGERVVAFVNAQDAAVTSEAIHAFCAARMADYKVPEFVVVADRALPRNANGKIQKAELRERAREPGGPR